MAFGGGGGLNAESVSSSSSNALKFIPLPILGGAAGGELSSDESNQNANLDFGGSGLSSNDKLKVFRLGGGGGIKLSGF